MSIKRHLFSASFRVVILYVLFYLITAIGFLWLMFSVLGAEIENSVKSEIEREFAVITDSAARGPEDLESRVASLLSKADPRISLYILLDENGETIRSNYPYAAPTGLNWVHLREIEDEDLGVAVIDDEETLFSAIDLVPSNSHDEGYVALAAKVGRQTLVVGRSLDRINETKGIFARIALIVLPLSLFFATLGGMLLSRMTLNRIDVINAQCRTILHRGDLSIRIPNEKPDDEYGLLISNINDLLENIEAGVKNVQEVSDDVAHDLRTPLTRIKYGLESGLLDPRASANDLLDVIGTGLKETDTLLETFSAILRVSQINTGLRKSKFRRFDLAALATNVVEAYEPTAEERGHKLSVSCAPDICEIDGDKDMITQMISNMIENAFQHAGPGLNIRVGVACKPDGAELSIADNGVGVPSVEAENIFRKFYRLDKSRGESGSGLGLSIVKAVADLHDCELRVDDNRPGVRFMVRFPRSDV